MKRGTDEHHIKRKPQQTNSASSTTACAGLLLPLPESICSWTRQTPMKRRTRETHLVLFRLALRRNTLNRAVVKIFS